MMPLHCTLFNGAPMEQFHLLHHWIFPRAGDGAKQRAITPSLRVAPMAHPVSNNALCANSALATPTLVGAPLSPVIGHRERGWMKLGSPLRVLIFNVEPRTIALGRPCRLAARAVGSFAALDRTNMAGTQRTHQRTRQAACPSPLHTQCRRPASHTAGRNARSPIFAAFPASSRHLTCALGRPWEGWKDIYARVANYNLTMLRTVSPAREGPPVWTIEPPAKRLKRPDIHRSTDHQGGHGCRGAAPTRLADNRPSPPIARLFPQNLGGLAFKVATFSQNPVCCQ
jgi:hypothetical protein